MTRRKPNTEGLKKSAQCRREETIESTEVALRQLIKQGEKVDFAVVARVAKVSRTWLYTNEPYRSQIKMLRSKSQSKKFIPSSLKPSESSKDTIIQTLRQRVKNLAAENQELRNQVEVAYGLANQNVIKEQAKEIEDLTKQNQHLTKLLIQAQTDEERI